MKKILSAFAAILFLMMPSCAAPSASKDGARIYGMEKMAEAEVLRAPENVYVSPLAEEKFMDPVNSFSFDRSDPIEYVMLHFSSNIVLDRSDPYNVDKIIELFRNTKASANYLIDRDGTIYCLIPENRCAWHAGNGSWKDDGRLTNSMNMYSIGIEILAIGTYKEMAHYLTLNEYYAVPKEYKGYTDAQYESLKLLINDICVNYGIPADRDHVIGHDEYAPGRKTDPGALFDWSRVLACDS